MCCACRGPYRFQLREISNKGKKTDWKTGVANPRTLTGTYFGSVHEAEVRVWARTHAHTAQLAV